MKKIKSMFYFIFSISSGFIGIFITALPLIMMHSNFFLSFIILTIISAVPIVGTILRLLIWIIALFFAIQGEQDFFAILYYVAFTLLIVPELIIAMNILIQRVREKFSCNDAKETIDFKLIIEKSIKHYRKDCLKTLCNESDSKNISKIFGAALFNLRKLKRKELKKEMKLNNIDEDMAALNIIHITSMLYLKDGNLRDYILKSGMTHTAVIVYKYINNMKYEQLYISQDVYEENDKLIQDIVATLSR